MSAATPTTAALTPSAADTVDVSVIRTAIRRKDWLRRAKFIDQLKRMLAALELETIRNMPYPLYWQTPQWADLRRRCFARDGHRCTRCGRTTARLRMHHLSRERIGQPEEIDDVTALCDLCHGFEHRYTAPGYYRRDGQMQLPPAA